MHRTDTPPLFPALTPSSEDADLDRLFRPSLHFKSPFQVVADKELSRSQKRAILSSWASDACAVESCPALRRPPGFGAAIPFDEIMDALHQLDETSGVPDPEADAGRQAHPRRLLA
jgi:hypothetical protein